MNEGNIPDDWTKSIILTMPKKGDIISVRTTVLSA